MGAGHPIVKYRYTLQLSVQKQLKLSRCHLVVGSDGPKESCVRWGSKSPMGRGSFWGKEAPIVKYRDFLLSTVQKLLN